MSARNSEWTLAEQYVMKRGGRAIQMDGARVESFKLPYGYGEDKDSDDDREAELAKKFQTGYPKENILFQSPDRAILHQDGVRVFVGDIHACRQRPLDLGFHLANGRRRIEICGHLGPTGPEVTRAIQQPTVDLTDADSTLARWPLAG